MMADVKCNGAGELPGDEGKDSEPKGFKIWTDDDE